MCNAYRHSSHLARDLARPTSYPSRLVGRLDASDPSESAAVLAQPVRSKACSTPRDLWCALAEADASFKSTMQARDTGWVALSNGRANSKPLFLYDQHRKRFRVERQENVSKLRSGGQPRPCGLR